MARQYKVEKLVDGEWYYEGTWNKPEHLGESMFELGKIAGVIDQVRITAEEDDILEAFVERLHSNLSNRGSANIHDVVNDTLTQFKEDNQ